MSLPLLIFLWFLQCFILYLFHSQAWSEYFFQVCDPLQDINQDKERAEILAEKAKDLLAKYEENAQQSELDKQTLRDELAKMEAERSSDVYRVEKETVETQRAAPVLSEDLGSLLEAKEAEVKHFQEEIVMLSRKNAVSTKKAVKKRNVI